MLKKQAGWVERSDPIGYEEYHLIKKKRIRFSLRRGACFIFAAVFIMLFAAQPARCGHSAGEAAKKEAVLKRASRLIHSDETDRKNMQKAVELLESFFKEFPRDKQFPVYLAEAYYRAANPEQDIDRTYPYFQKAGDYAQVALELDPDCIEAHYWNGLFLLRKAQKTNIFSAYFVAREGIHELERVRDVMPGYDHAGASRTLGLLYAKAPEWSPFGDREKALRLAEETTRIAPNYLLNRVYLAEAYGILGKRQAAVRQWHKVLAATFLAPGQPVENPFKKKARNMIRRLERDPFYTAGS